MTTGFAAIQLIEALIDGQVRSATLQRDQFAKHLAHEIGEVFGESLSAERRNSLFKALRMKNPLNEKAIAENLPWIPPDLPDEFRTQLTQVDKLSAEAHQARTQAAFVSGVLKPFNPKIVQRWLDERADVEVGSYLEAIKRLQDQRLTRLDQLIEWADEIATVFRELVVVDEVSDDVISRKPYGTVSSRSSRTYVQAWLNFIRRHSNLILQVDSDFDTPDLNQDVRPMQPASPSASKLYRSGETEPLLKFAGQNRSQLSESPKLGYSKSETDRYLVEAASMMREALAENESLKSAITPSQQKEGRKTAEETGLRSVESFKPGLTIYAESAAGEKSSCYFENLSSAEIGIAMWVDTLKQIWSGEADTVKFRAEAKIKEEQFAFDLPRFSLDEAAEKLMPFTQRLSALQAAR